MVSATCQRLALKHILSQNRCAGRLLESIFTHNGQLPVYTDEHQALVEFIIYAVSGSRASADIGLDLMKSLSTEPEKKIRVIEPATIKS